MKRFRFIEISPIYQSIHQFADRQVGSGAPEQLSFEHFLPWIWKMMLVYQEQKNPENQKTLPEGIRYSKTYYTKKFK